MSLSELRPHLHTHADDPTGSRTAPRTTHRAWGFCLARQQLDRSATAPTRSSIDSSLAPGSLTYAECSCRASEDEVLLTTHVCHPSLANDNLSGIALLTELGSVLAERGRVLSYRLLFIPGTIGSITLARPERGALVGSSAGWSSRASGTRAAHVQAQPARRRARRPGGGARLGRVDEKGRVVDFVPWGWDERQFNSPGFDLPVGCLTRSPEGEFAEYHSSADDLDLIRPAALEARSRRSSRSSTSSRAIART